MHLVVPGLADKILENLENLNPHIRHLPFSTIMRYLYSSSQIEKN